MRDSKIYCLKHMPYLIKEVNSMSTSIIILISVLFIFIASIVLLYNRIISSFNTAKRGWADIITYELNKLNIIPKLEESVQKYQSYEGNILPQIVKLRNAMARLDRNIINPDDLSEIQEISNILDERVRFTVENYPDLRSVELYLRFMHEWAEACKDVTAAIAIYNSCVCEFNNSIQYFPGLIINGMFLRKEALNEFTDSTANANFKYQPNF